jgi:hypothetical protein
MAGMDEAEVKRTFETSLYIKAGVEVGADGKPKA